MQTGMEGCRQMQRGADRYRGHGGAQRGAEVA